MRATPTGISEAHEVDVYLTCDAGLYVVPEQLVERLTAALRDARVDAAAALVGKIEHDGGVCSYEGTVEGFYLDDETAEAECPKCGTIHEVDL